MNKFIFCAISAALLAGCAMQPIPSQYRNATITLVGQSKAEAMTDLGIPTRTMPVNGSQTMYQWDSNQGTTSAGSFSTDTNGVAVGNSTYQGYGNGFSGGAVGTSENTGNYGSATATHICALSLLIDNKTDKVLSGTFNGTVDDACMSHFSNVITLDPNAVNANKAAIMHNQHVKEAKAVVGVLAIVGAGVAAYNNR
ncbi:hypothetical protein MX657_10625 [Enterobacter chuandaensis]|uniref:hypothetical protein n=1 Tax=Enterobacter chuandaensis TaxID=2497875 RepID=UPI003217CD04